MKELLKKISAYKKAEIVEALGDILQDEYVAKALLNYLEDKKRGDLK